MRLVKRALTAAALLAGCLGATYIAATLALMRPDAWRIDVALASHLSADYSRDPHDTPMRAPLDPAVADAASFDEQMLDGLDATATRMPPVRPSEKSPTPAPAPPEPTASATPKPRVEKTPAPTKTYAPEPTKTRKPEVTPTPKPTETLEPKPTKTATPTGCPDIIVHVESDEDECATPTPRPTKTPEPTKTPIDVDCELFPDLDPCEVLPTIVIDL